MISRNRDAFEHDVAVVGGGIVGVSAALRLALEGVRVVIYDAELEGKASAAGAGIVSPVGLGGDEASQEWSLLVASAIDQYHKLLDLLSQAGMSDVGFSKVGEIVVATRDADIARLDDLERRLTAFAEAGIPIGQLKRLDGSGLRRYWPEFRAELEGLYIENIARMDGRRMCAALAELARSKGAMFVRGQAELKRDNDGSVALLVDNAPVRAQSIIVAAGSWSRPMLEMLNARIKVEPVRGQIVHLKLADDRTGTRPVINTFEGHYFLGFPDGRVVVGGTHEPEAGFDCRVTAGGVHSVLEKSLRAAPGLSAGTLLETRVGLRPRSSDGYPIVGRPKSADNVVVATGLGAWGLTLGPLIGDIAAEQVLGLSPSFNADFLGPDRNAIDRVAMLSPNIQ